MVGNKVSYYPNIRLAKNFILREAIEWAVHLPMSNEDVRKATDLAMKNLNPQVLVYMSYQAMRLQHLRDSLNRDYPDLKLRIRVTSWLRPVEWEHYRGRDGTSQHTTGHATDIVVIGAPAELHESVMESAYKKLKILRGFTKKYDTFIHNDQRGIFI